MATENTERFAKQIIAGSRLEISTAGFNNMVMQKIFLAERKKAMKRALLCWFLGLVSLGIILFLGVLSFYQNNLFPVGAISSFVRQAMQFFNENVFIILSLVIFYLSYKLFTRKKIPDYLPDLNFEPS